jgi:hypothetical protein
MVKEIAIAENPLRFQQITDGYIRHLVEDCGETGWSFYTYEEASRENLEIGDKVGVEFVLFPSYRPVFCGFKYPQKRDLLAVQPFAPVAWYVGWTYKQVGTLYQGDGIQRSLEEIKPVLCARLRFTPRGKEHVAYFNDLIPMKKLRRL